MDKEFIEILKTKRDSLNEEIKRLIKEIELLRHNLDKKSSQVDNIDALLRLEEISNPSEIIIEKPLTSLSDMAFEYLDSRQICDPIHYLELTQSLQKAGFFIPGKNPAANLLTSITRDDRFYRTKPGTYALSKWNKK